MLNVCIMFCGLPYPSPTIVCPCRCSHKLSLGQFLCAQYTLEGDSKDAELDWLGVEGGNELNVDCRIWGNHVAAVCYTPNPGTATHLSRSY